MRCPLASSVLAARSPANGSRRVLAGSPIRVGQQAQQAVALPAEQPPASIPASLLEGTKRSGACAGRDGMTATPGEAAELVPASRSASRRFEPDCRSLAKRDC
jgi:hypothetical protein